MSLKKCSRLAAGSIAVALAACGGGGDSGGAGAGGPLQAVAITETNAAAVSAEAIDAGGAARAGSGMLMGVEVSAAQAAPTTTMAVLVDALRQARAAQAPAAVVGATVTTTTPCPGGGSATYAINEADPDRTTPGDRADLTFNACIQNGLAIDGSLAAIVLSADDSGVVTDVSAGQFTATRLGFGGRLHGAVRVTMDDTDPAKEVLQASGSSLSFDRIVSGNVRASRTLTNYTFRSETTVATGSTSETFSYDASGQFPRLGTVTFSALTTQPVVTPDGADHPTSGAGRVTGASGSSVTITVVTGGVRLDIDRNGDTIIDTTLMRTWDQIDGEL